MLKNNKIVVVLFGGVYDMTNFIEVHPGGKDSILEWKGKDATDKFVEAGHLKGANIIKTLASLRLGKI